MRLALLECRVAFRGLRQGYLLDPRPHARQDRELHCVFHFFRRPRGMANNADVTPMVTSSPSGKIPPTVAAMAPELPAVASTTVAPPNAFSASEGSLAVESM